MHITGQGSKKEFQNYIGKTENDYAKNILQYWNKPKPEKNNQNLLEIIT